jgi:hypothetical protein
VVVRKFYDRLSGKNELAGPAAEAIRSWAESSRALLHMLELGSIITPAERTLILCIIKNHLDSPVPENFPTEILDQMHDLERRLMADDARVNEYAEEMAAALNAEAAAQAYEESLREPG